MADSSIPKRSSVTILSMVLFFCLLLLLTWFLGWSGATQKTDNLLHDNWVRFSQTAPPEQVAIAGIDPASLKELGRWPWSRELQSLLFRQLAGYNIKAAVIDMLFIEPSAEKDVDKALAASMSGIDIVILPILTEGRLGAQEKLPLAALMREVDDLGHILLPIDNDGIVRRVFLRAGVNTPHWSSLALSAYAKIDQPNTDVTIGLPGNRQKHSQLANNWEQDYEVRIPFYGPSGTIPNVSALSIINGTAPRDALENKVVFVGFTSTGLDVLPTPVSALDQPVPGVEIHANIYSALVDGRLKSQVDSRLNILVALLLFPLMLLVYSRAPPQWGLIIATIGSVLPVLMSFVLYHLADSWYAPLSASIPLFISYILWSWNRLNYLNRFLERETALLAPLSQLDNSENDLLVDFFRNAERHLPIQGWRFSAKGQHFSGGIGSPRAIEKPPLNRWVSSNGIYSKRYPTQGKLEMSVSIEDEKVARQLTGYIDTLARVKSRTRPPPLSGSIERLQINTLKLSDQVAGLRNISAVSDSILEGSPAGLIVWNAAGEMVRGNELVFELIPSLDNNVLLIDFINKVMRKTDGDNADDRQRIQELILDSASWQITYVDGERESVINFNTVGASLTDRLVCATVIDVSEIRSAERARSEMVDYLSHDLRSPLISALYLLEGEEDGVDNKISQRIQSNINRSLRMMDDLLHVSRADSLSADKFEEVLFNSVVDNALDQLLPQARSRNIQFEIETTDDDLWMNGDAASLERAVANVVGNAIKYSNEGGRVTTRTERQGDHVLLEVSDDGVGIDPAMMGDLFTRFKRDAKVAKKFQGIGLGLALVAKVVTQHSGEVKAVSPGSGTTIRMLLPLISDNSIGVE